MLLSAPPNAPGPVRQGGKEELRASILKTYLLRAHAERGERAVRQLLANAGIDPSAIDNETGWLSQAAAKRALYALAELLGRDALFIEASGLLIPKLSAPSSECSARAPDLWMHIASSPRTPARAPGSVPGRYTPYRGEVARTTPYRARANDVSLSSRRRRRSRSRRPTSERSSSAMPARRARWLPRIWGLPEAEVRHDTAS